MTWVIYEEVGKSPRYKCVIFSKTKDEGRGTRESGIGDKASGRRKTRYSPQLRRCPIHIYIIVTSET